MKLFERILLTIIHCHILYDLVSSEICTDEICEYTFVVRHQRSMTYRDKTSGKSYDVALNGTRLQVQPNIFHKDGEILGTFVDADDVITLDGHQRNVITINGQFPGPTIEVMDGSQVVVHVENKLVLEGLSIHWHGMYMQETPWMDGVTYLTQCPILPHQKFTYRFQADPSGTHWYHGHFHGQRLDGLFGLLIVHERPPQLPYFGVTLMDWSHSDVIELDVQNAYHKESRGTGHDMVYFLNRGYAIDNNELTALEYTSALINGRGRYNELNPYPLENFTVQKGQRYRLRIAHTGAEYFFEISVDNHKLSLVASDGHDIVPIELDSLIIMPGEVYDIEINANQAVDNYWIRANTLKHGTGHYPKFEVNQQMVKAILRYEEAGIEQEPSSMRRDCTELGPCKVFNCPFESYPSTHYKTCISIGEARSVLHQDILSDKYGLAEDDDEVDEYFMNFAFPIGSSINARKFSEPRAPLSRSDSDKYITPCDDKMCDDNGCYCTYMQELKPGKTQQLVLMSYTPGESFMGHHSVHLHGHSFAVLKVGFAQQNSSTGIWEDQNQDMICTGDNIYGCTRPQWNGKRPTLNLEKPMIKDTVLIPSRGYTIIRFISDNPGFWLFHCHQETHNIEGMVMIFNEAPEKHKPPPKAFPTCGDFSWSREDYKEYRAGGFNDETTSVTEKPATKGPVMDTTCKPNSNDVTLPNTITMNQTTAIGVAFGFVLLGAFIALIPTFVFVCCKKRDKM